MAHEYDRIIKENIEAILLPLVKRVLKLPEPAGLVEIPDDLQRTIERRPDFLKIVTDELGQNLYVLQIEFQTVDEPKMLYRMLEYAALLIRRYELPVRQYVCYIGEGKARMNTRLSHEHVQFQFMVRNVSEVAYSEFLETDKPEEAVLAILGNLTGANVEDAIGQIVRVLYQLAPGELEREKFLRQLEILSKLRNLQLQTIKQIETMAIVYDMETDIRFLQGKQRGTEEALASGLIRGMQEGRQEGLQEGRQEGLQEGQQQAKRQDVQGLLRLGVLTIEQITTALDVSADYVLTVQADMRHTN